ncbi:YihY/virulence factor BrkB family protein [Antrihabitans sp. YC2-6]|uniref:YihY/virulence factor BrkB family protein n=1 Tax=Antrihabitans sp. YC2-6 TaxID=2799498 RepID=UPI0018F36C91|nr:YihY/virulence factor BrkB family protein [Antrihabitans sp. YC2-6]MBJ8345444.1 YihY/virulence factor BrkB family protein [Antrihabitans sp. YC2-6]
MLDRLDRVQRRFPPVGFVIAVVYKFVDDRGSFLAALITYYAFVSLFPILLLLTTVLGLVLAGNPGLQERVVESALSQFPVIGDQLANPGELSGGGWGLTIGVVGAIYGALGVGQAWQNAMDTVWSVPRNERRNPFLSRLRSLVLLLVLGIALGATAALSIVSGSFSSFGGLAHAGLLFGTTVIDTAVFVVAFRHGTAQTLAIKHVLPGAIVAAVFWQLLQQFGVYYIAEVVKSASTTNSVFAVVLGLFAFVYVAAAATVMCAEINAVIVGHLYPRALLGPFTDDVSLTAGDRAAYTDQAKAQRAKGFERVDVTFDEDGDGIPDEDPRSLPTQGS